MTYVKITEIVMATDFKKLKRFFLNIGNSTVEVKLLPAEVERAKEQLISQIFTSFGGFTNLTGNKKPDITIYFSNASEPYIVLEKDKLLSILLQFNGEKEAYTTYQISVFEFQLVLRAVIFRLLVNKKMLMLHASAVEIDGKAYIFLGNPGAGKSTAMKLLSTKYHALADDSVLISEEKGEFYFHQTPFHEKEAWIKRGSKKYPLGGVFFVNKSKEFYIKKITNSEILVQKIIGQSISEKTEDKKYLKIVMNFTANYSNINNIYFAKDSKKLVDLYRAAAYST